MIYLVLFVASGYQLHRAAYKRDEKAYWKHSLTGLAMAVGFWLGSLALGALLPPIGVTVLQVLTVGMSVQLVGSVLSMLVVWVKKKRSAAW